MPVKFTQSVTHRGMHMWVGVELHSLGVHGVAGQVVHDEADGVARAQLRIIAAVGDLAPIRCSGHYKQTSDYWNTTESLKR